jgi:hypothetical protein
MAHQQAKAKGPPAPTLPVPWNYAFVIVSGAVFWFGGWPISNCLLVVVSYGPHAYFVDGMRVINSHKGILSNGQQLNQGLDFGITLVMFFLVACVVYNILQAVRRRCAGGT